jgi:hypothetical protein
MGFETVVMTFDPSDPRHINDIWSHRKLEIETGNNGTNSTTSTDVEIPKNLFIIVTMLRVVLVVFGFLTAVILVLETASLSAEKRTLLTLKRRLPLYLMTILALFCFMIGGTMALADFRGYEKVCFILIEALIVCFIHSKQCMYLFLL